MRRLLTMVLSVVVVASLAPAGQAAKTCSAPGKKWARASAGAVGLDRAKLEEGKSVV